VNRYGVLERNKKAKGDLQRLSIVILLLAGRLAERYRIEITANIRNGINRA
jgi:hypothetical protein